MLRRWEAGAVLVEVLVTGKNGVTAPHLYALGRETDGWKVQGVSGGLPARPAPRVRRRIVPPTASV